jgi:hypothetical protein
VALERAEERLVELFVLARAERLQEQLLCIALASAYQPSSCSSEARDLKVVASARSTSDPLGTAF